MELKGRDGKDSSDVIEFMTSFQALRDAVADSPSDLAKRALADHAVKGLCDKLEAVATKLAMTEKMQRRLFAAPVDPTFIAAWRDYEARYQDPIAEIFWSTLDLGAGEPSAAHWSRTEALWELADDDARDDALALEGAIAFALEQVSQNHREFDEGLRESIEEADDAWSRLKEEVGFDLRGIFRRREMVPFVLIPRHVAKHHGEGEKLSLLTHLQEAHDAFVLGVHFAALALMRSVLEATLRVHYRAPGADLKERIDKCSGLPPRCSKMALHDLRMLANDVLHVDKVREQLPKDLERKLLRLLNVLRVLIEGAPSPSEDGPSSIPASDSRRTSRAAR